MTASIHIPSGSQSPWPKAVCAGGMAMMVSLYPGGCASSVLMFFAKLSCAMRVFPFFHVGGTFSFFFIMKKLGYDWRALIGCFMICTGMCAFSLCLLPSAGAILADPRTPKNLQQAFGLDGMRPKEWIDPGTYVFLLGSAFTALVYQSANALLKSLMNVQIRNVPPSRER